VININASHRLDIQEITENKNRKSHLFTVKTSTFLTNRGMSYIHALQIYYQKLKRKRGERKYFLLTYS